MIGIQESFNNVKIICHNASLRREEWLAVEESLKNISEALQSGIAAAAKIELLEKSAVTINSSAKRAKEEEGSEDA